jgi:hypothetical protein
MLFAIVVPGTIAVAQPANRIDATHILMQEIELPERTRALAASGLSFADVDPEQPAREKKIGQQDPFWVRNISTGQFEQITASLRVIGKHCYIYAADDQDVSQTAVQKIQNEFDNTIYPVNTSHFGYEWKPGIDADNRVFLLLSDIQDGYQNKNDGYVAGYFFAGDQMMQSEFSGHSKVKSNEKEIIYIDTYPSDPESENYMEIVAHEFQHMIHYNQDSNEVTWVNEGCSQIAPVLCGFTAPRHYKLLKSDADRSLNNWAKWNPMPDYGQVYLWNQYVLELLNKKNLSPANFFKSLASSKEISIGGYIEAFAKHGLNFSDVFTEFTVANHLNDSTIGDGRFSYLAQHLKNFRLPQTKEISAFPAHEKDSVSIWGSDSFAADIGDFAGSLKIAFSGYRRTMASTRPYFRIAVVLKDSFGNSKPQISFMKLKVNSADNNRLIGSVKVNCDGTYDKAFVVIMALAPEEVNDAEYMPVSGFIYDLRLEADATMAAVAAANTSTSFNMQAFVNKISATAKMPSSESVLRIRENYAHKLLLAVRKELEDGSLQTVDAFIAAGENLSELMSPYARDIAGMLRFYQASHAAAIAPQALQTRINILDSF